MKMLNAVEVVVATGVFSKRGNSNSLTTFSNKAAASYHFSLIFFCWYQLGLDDDDNDGDSQFAGSFRLGETYNW